MAAVKIDASAHGSRNAPRTSDGRIRGEPNRRRRGTRAGTAYRTATRRAFIHAVSSDFEKTTSRFPSR